MHDSDLFRLSQFLTVAFSVELGNLIRTFPEGKRKRKKKKKKERKIGKFCGAVLSKLKKFSPGFSQQCYVSMEVFFFWWISFFQFSQGEGPVILELPVDKIQRPLLRTRSNDPEKVKELMESIREIGLQVPMG